MTEEKATILQINYAKSLNIQNPEMYSKKALSELINVAKAEKEAVEADLKGSEQTVPNVPIERPGEAAKTQPGAPEKEYHLTQEAQRAHALRCAIEHLQPGVETSILMNLAKQFKKYIETGE